jgi:ABC-type antimicrobial peptide transport system permease subunit
MRWIDILASSFSNLTRRKLRTALTMLGVVIGSTAIIVTISLGYGAEKTQMEAMEQNTNLRIISVSPYYDYGDSGDGGGRRVTKIDDQVVRQIQAMKHIEAATPVTMLYGSVYFTFEIGKLQASLPFTVVDGKAIEKLLKLKEGSYFSGRTDRVEFLLSEMTMINFMDPKKEDTTDYQLLWDLIDKGESLPVSTDVHWLKDKFTVRMQWDDYENADSESGEPKHYEKELKGSLRGILDVNYNDGNMGYFTYGAVISTDYYKALMRDNKKLFKDYTMPDLKEYSQIMVMADTVDNVEQISKDLKEFGVQSYSPLDYIRQMRDQIRTMQVFMGFIGAISMFVAALSIANTMMMSIYERTREIGVMKVLGCKMANIRMMFLCEAAYIGIFGGLIGLALSYLLSFLLNNEPRLQGLIAQFMAGAGSFGDGANTSIIPRQLAATTFAFVVAVSVISGFYPAQRAMHLSSLAAIRSD